MFEEVLIVNKYLLYIDRKHKIGDSIEYHAMRATDLADAIVEADANFDDSVYIMRICIQSSYEMIADFSVETYVALLEKHSERYKDAKWKRPARCVIDRSISRFSYEIYTRRA